MKIFQKTFLYTLALLVLIALLANWLIYTLMPSFYTKQKQLELYSQAAELVQKLSSARREDIVDLIGSYASGGQSNITINIGEDKYALITWSNASSGNTPASYFSVTTTAIPCSTDKDEVFNVIITDTGSEHGNVIKVSDGNAFPVSHNFLNMFQTIETQCSFTMGDETGTLTISMTLAPVKASSLLHRRGECDLPSVSEFHIFYTQAP